MPPELQELFARLAELNRDELNDLQTRLAAAGEELADATDPDSIEALGAIADAYEAVGARIVEVDAEADELASRRQAALDRMRPAGDDAADDAAGDAPAADDAAADDAAPAAVAASAGTGGARTAPRGRVPALGTVAGSRSAEPTYTAPRAVESALVAAADVAGMSSGQEFTSRQQLGQAFDRRREAVARSKGSTGDPVVVATLSTTYPEERRLGKDTLSQNMTRIREATTPEAMVAAAAARNAGAPLPLVAAGGLCAPLENLYDVEVLGVADRPIRDSLAQFGADRGGIAWRPAPRFADLDAATGFWTMDDDAAVGVGDPADDPSKNCLEVLCEDGEEAIVEAVYTCLKFRNVAARFDPEMTAANIDAAMIAAARKAENRLLAKIAATSTSVTTSQELGATRDLLSAVDHVVAAYRSQHRLNGNVPLRAILPQWIMDVMRTDLARSMGSAYDPDALALADAQIVAYFTRRNINVTFHIDGRGAIAGAAGVPAMAGQVYGGFVEGGAVPAFPSSVEWFLYPEGSLLFLDGGTLDLGIVRDASLVKENAYKSFTEAWEGLANRAEESLRVVSSILANGAVSGTVDPATVAA